MRNPYFSRKDEQQLNYLTIEKQLNNWTEEGNSLLAFLPQKHEQKLKRREITDSIKNTRQKLYYLKSGLMESSLNVANQEIILGFHQEGEWFSDCFAANISLGGQIITSALKSVELEYFYYDELKEAFHESTVATQLAQFVLQQSCERKSKHEQLLLLSKGRMRYEFFIDNQTNLALTLSAKKIAAYLGMTPESLSRIRKSIFLDAKSKSVSNAA